MKYFEFGEQNKEVMVLLHGGGTCYLGAIPTAQVLAEKYHIVLVAYDGFNPDEPQTEFVSVEKEARQLGNYILEKFSGKIDILYGVSFGCRVLLEVLADARLTVTTAIADGMSTRDLPDIKSEWAKNLYLFFFTGFFYVIMGRAGPRRKRFIAKITGRTPEEAERLIYTKATWKSWRNMDYCLIGKKINFEDFKRTHMYIWHGGQGSVEKKLAKNMGEWKKNGYVFTYKFFGDLGHGGLAGENRERFLEEIVSAHEKSLKKNDN